MQWPGSDAMEASEVLPEQAFSFAEPSTKQIALAAQGMQHHLRSWFEGESVQVAGVTD